MKPTTEQLKREVEKRRAGKEQEKLADLHAEKTASHLARLFDNIAKGLGDLSKQIERKEFNVEKVIAKTEFPKIQEINGEVEITNLPRIQPVEVTNPPSREVEVINQIDLEPLRADLNEAIRALDDVIAQSEQDNGNRFFELRDFLKGISGIMMKQDGDILRALSPLQFLSNDPMKPLSVRLSDGEKFYKAFGAAMSRMEQVVSASGSISVKDVTDLKNLLQSIVDNTNTLITENNLIQNATDLGRGFGLDTNAIIVASTIESPLVLIKNPAGSGKQIRLGTLLTSAGVTSNVVQKSFFRFYRNPTIISNGSALAIYKIKGTQTQNTVASAFLNPVVSNNGTRLISGIVVNGITPIELQLSAYIMPNEAWLVTVQPSATGIDHILHANWIEE